MENNNNEKKEFAPALWIKKTKNGDTYYSVSIKGQNYSFFKNKYKTKETQPDYIEIQKKEDKPQPVKTENEEDGIPF